ncbi:hypothetical protein LguiA_020575 [Lonicera macranthoides]
MVNYETHKFTQTDPKSAFRGIKFHLIGSEDLKSLPHVLDMIDSQLSLNQHVFDVYFH